MAHIKTKVAQYTIDGELVAVHDSICAAARTVGVDPQSIRYATQHNSVRKGYYWKRVSLPRTADNKAKAVWQWTTDGVRLAEYETMRAAERYTGAPANNIGRCIKGTAWSCGGYRWTKSGVNLVVDENPHKYNNTRANFATSKRVVIVPINWREAGATAEESALFFPSIRSALRGIGAGHGNDSYASRAISGVRASACGYYWFDADVDNLSERVANLESRIAKATNKPPLFGCP